MEGNIERRKPRDNGKILDLEKDEYKRIPLDPTNPDQSAPLITPVPESLKQITDQSAKKTESQSSSGLNLKGDPKARYNVDDSQLFEKGIIRRGKRRDRKPPEPNGPSAAAPGALNAGPKANPQNGEAPAQNAAVHYDFDDNGEMAFFNSDGTPMQVDAEQKLKLEQEMANQRAGNPPSQGMPELKFGKPQPGENNQVASPGALQAAQDARAAEREARRLAEEQLGPESGRIVGTRRKFWINGDGTVTILEKGVPITVAAGGSNKFGRGEDSRLFWQGAGEGWVNQTRHDELAATVPLTEPAAEPAPGPVDPAAALDNARNAFADDHRGGAGAGGGGPTQPDDPEVIRQMRERNLGNGAGNIPPQEPPVPPTNPSGPDQPRGPQSGGPTSSHIRQGLGRPTVRPAATTTPLTSMLFGVLPSFVKRRIPPGLAFEPETMDVIQGDKRKLELFNEFMELTGKEELRNKYLGDQESMTKTDIADMKEMQYQFGERLALAEEMKKSVSKEDLLFMFGAGAFDTVSMNLKPERGVEIIRKYMDRFFIRATGADIDQFVHSQRALGQIRESQRYNQFHARTIETMRDQQYRPEDVDQNIFKEVAKGRWSEKLLAFVTIGGKDWKKDAQDAQRAIALNRTAMMAVLDASVSKDPNLRAHVFDEARYGRKVPEIGANIKTTRAEFVSGQNSINESLDTDALLKKIEDPKFKKDFKTASGKNWDDASVSERMDSVFEPYHVQEERRKQEGGWFASFLAALLVTLMGRAQQDPRLQAAFAKPA